MNSVRHFSIRNGTKSLTSLDSSVTLDKQEELGESATNCNREANPVITKVKSTLPQGTYKLYQPDIPGLGHSPGRASTYRQFFGGIFLRVELSFGESVGRFKIQETS